MFKRATWGVFLLVLLTADAAYCQIRSSSITGIVSDASGAVIVGAQVTVTELQTAISNSTKTSEAGFFTVPYELSIQTTYWGTRRELIEVLDLAARGLLTPEISTFPLEKGPQVYAGLAAGDITGRAVVVPSAEYTP